MLVGFIIFLASLTALYIAVAGKPVGEVVAGVLNGEAAGGR